MVQIFARTAMVFSYIHVYCKYSLLLTSLLWISFVCSSQEPSLSISKTNVTLKEGDTFSFLCTALNPAPDGTFTWTHLGISSNRPNVYNVTTSEAFPRIKVIENGSTAIQYSSFAISNVTIDDSGIISCSYSYPTASNISEMDIKIQKNVSVCISQQPEPPSCFTRMHSTSVLCIVPHGICSDDITIRWFDFDSMQELNTTDGTKVDNELATYSSIDNYLCVLESKLYPDIHLNCSVSIPSKETSTTRITEPLGFVTPSATSDLSATNTSTQTTTVNASTKAVISRNTTIDTVPIAVSTTTSSVNTDDVDSSSIINATNVHASAKTTLATNGNSKFTLTFLIVAVFAGGGGMFIVIAFVIILYFACKKCIKTIPDSNFDIDFELTKGEIFPTNKEKPQDHINEPNYFVLEKENELAETDNTQLYTKPNKDGDMLNGIPNSGFDAKDNILNTNLYASVHECTDEFQDRPKLDSPVKVNQGPNEYTYAYADIGKNDSLTSTNSTTPDNSEILEDSCVEQSLISEPHYFVLEKEGNKELARPESMPIYAKPDKGEYEKS